MRLAISNIAWDVAGDSAVAALLGSFGIDAIDVAPGKYFPDPARATDEQIAEVRRWWADHGIEITGMQSLLFGTSGLNVFGDAASRKAMLEHLKAVCRIGAGLGATRLVFGSPRNRDRSGLTDDEAMELALQFFTSAGDAARAHGVILCLEPNPVRYGANFMTTSPETAGAVRALGHSAIRMQFDTGALTINGEAPEAVLEGCAGLIGHIHASEPDLVPLGDGGTDHHAMHAALVRHVPDLVVTVEMVAAANEPHLAAIRRALACARACYQPEAGVQP